MLGKTFQLLGKGVLFVIVGIAANVGSKKVLHWMGNPHEHPFLEKGDIKKLARYDVTISKLKTEIEQAITNNNSEPTKAYAMGLAKQMDTILDNFVQDYPSATSDADELHYRITDPHLSPYDRLRAVRRAAQHTQSIIEDLLDPYGHADQTTE